VSTAEDFAQYQLHFIDPIQYDYEVIRPIVLFAETVAERSRQTGLERTTIGAKARRFIHDGMLGLVDQRAGHAGHKGHHYPEAVAAYMLYLNFCKLGCMAYSGWQTSGPRHPLDCEGKQP